MCPGLSRDIPASLIWRDMYIIDGYFSTCIHADPLDIPAGEGSQDSYREQRLTNLHMITITLWELLCTLC